MVLEKLYASKTTGVIDTKEGWLDDWQKLMESDNEAREEGVALLTCATAEEYWEEIIDRFDELELFKEIKTYFEDSAFFDNHEDEEEDTFTTSVTYKEETWRITCTIYKMLTMENTYKVLSTWTNIHNDLDDFGEWACNTDLKVVFEDGKDFDDYCSKEAITWYVEHIAFNTLEEIEEQAAK